MLVADHPGARRRRRDDRVEAGEYVREPPDERHAVGAIAGVEVHLPAARLALGELDVLARRRSRWTVAWPTCGNSMSLKHVMNSATFTRRSCPPCRPAGAGSADLGGAADHRPQVLEPAGEQAVGARLTSRLPMAVASTGPATTGSPSASASGGTAGRCGCRPRRDGRRPRRGRRSSPRRGPWRRTPPPGCRGCPHDGCLVGEGRAAAAATSAETGRACRPAAAATGRRGRRRAAAGRSAAAASRAGSEGWRAGPLPGPDRLLEQPQAHDVAQEPDPPVDAQPRW